MNMMLGGRIALRFASPPGKKKLVGPHALLFACWRAMTGD
jgi:hypothetical protein